MGLRGFLRVVCSQGLVAGRVVCGFGRLGRARGSVVLGGVLVVLGRLAVVLGSPAMILCRRVSLSHQRGRRRGRRLCRHLCRSLPYVTERSRRRDGAARRLSPVTWGFGTGGCSPWQHLTSRLRGRPVRSPAPASPSPSAAYFFGPFSPGRSRRSLPAPSGLWFERARVGIASGEDGERWTRRRLPRAMVSREGGADVQMGRHPRVPHHIRVAVPRSPVGPQGAVDIYRQARGRFVAAGEDASYALSHQATTAAPRRRVRRWRRTPGARQNP